jgi:hypothetical protein
VEFEIHHDFDTPLGILEEALLSPELGPLLGETLPSLESIEARRHELTGDALCRVWRFQARAPLPIFASRRVTRDMLTWEEEWTYSKPERSARWQVVPRPGIDPEASWRRRFHASGTYRLAALDEGRSRRSVAGEMRIELPWIGRLVERMALSEMRKAYAAEARILSTLCASSAAKAPRGAHPPAVRGDAR